MRFQLLPLAVLATLSTTVLAVVNTWGQCGGLGYTGETVCVAGTACVKNNDFWSQCIPVPTTSTTSTSSSSSSSSTPIVTPTTTPATTTTTSSTACGAAIGARSTGQPIKAITAGSAVSGLYLGRDSATGKGILTTSLVSPYLFAGASIWRREYVGSNGCLVTSYLNIHNATTSYKPIYWDYNQVLTTFWDPNSSIIQTAGTSPYGTKSQFLACQEGSTWVVYFQTGTDVPSGVTCATTQLKIG